MSRSGSVSNDAAGSESARTNARGARAPGDRSTTGGWDHPSRGGRVAGIAAGFGWSGETGRTPGSAAGCNKPARRSAEKTGEVVRNHAVGTGLPDGIRRPKVTGLGSWLGVDARRSFARRCKADGGAMGPGVRGNPGDRSDPRRGGRCEPVRAAGRCSEGEPKSGSTIRWQQCRLVYDAVRKTSKVRRHPAQAETVVRPGRMRGRPNDPLRSAAWSEHRRAIFGSVPKPAPGELHGSGAA